MKIGKVFLVFIVPIGLGGFFHSAHSKEVLKNVLVGVLSGNNEMRRGVMPLFAKQGKDWKVIPTGEQKKWNGPLHMTVRTKA